MLNKIHSMSDTVVCITNLPESMILANVEELVKKIGPYQKIYLARDYMTRLCKVFAVVTFKQHADAAKAIQQLNGYNYDGFILIVEWSQPQYAASRATVSEDLNQPFIAKKKQEKKSNDPAIDPMKKFSKCRFRGGDYLTNEDCSRKDTLMKTDKLADVKPPTTTETINAKPGKCVPPSSFTADASTIYITNLHKSTVYADLEKLAKIIGPHMRIFLGRDPITRRCKGFAYVTFKQYKDAAKAIELLNGHKYGHSTLIVEWAMPQVGAPTATVSECLDVPINASKKEKKSNDPAVDSKSRFCGGDHSSNDCPRKDASMKTAKLAEVKPSTMTETIDAKPGKYVSPYKVSCPDATSICITNLAESMVLADLEELVKKIGPYKKIYLGRHRITGLCKGFAYVTFKQRKDAAKAIQLLDGHGYDHLILKVYWSKPKAAAPTPMVSEDLNIPFITSKDIRKRHRKLADDIAMASAKLVKYVPPYKEKPKRIRRHDYTSVRISNLPESMVEAYLESLVKNIGSCKKIFLARDRTTGLCKGFAFVTFALHDDAAKAIKLMNGHNFDDFILKVEWCKPFTQN